MNPTLRTKSRSFWNRVMLLQPAQPLLGIAERTASGSGSIPAGRRNLTGGRATMRTPAFVDLVGRPVVGSPIKIDLAVVASVPNEDWVDNAAE